MNLFALVLLNKVSFSMSVFQVSFGKKKIKMLFQLLMNPGLALCDIGCVGVQFRRPDEGRIWLAPIFSVNMEHHWRHYTKIFYTILVTLSNKYHL